MRFLVPLALLLASCGDEYQQPVNGWEVVETVSGKDVAQGVKLAPVGALWSATILPGAELDGVSKSIGPIAPGSTVRIRYRVSGEGLYPAPDADLEPGSPAILTIMIQRAGDDWSGRGQYSGFRQYTTTPLTLAPGEHEATVTLAHPCCHNVLGQHGGLEQTLAGAQRIWLAFGHWNGRMHGVRADEPVTFELLAFEVV
ncbi:hypothetical protein [Qipengyuania sp. MTN3-11]|uniref:hypothetical protein n=1 Tax=Qipengyuania sp. MTN3-11 TaxID=3056557 RepID=UPI0036F252F7